MMSYINQNKILYVYNIKINRNYPFSLINYDKSRVLPLNQKNLHDFRIMRSRRDFPSIKFLRSLRQPFPIQKTPFHNKTSAINFANALYNWRMKIVSVRLI